MNDIFNYKTYRIIKMRTSISPLNVSDSYWILCHTVLAHSLYIALYDGLLFMDLLNNNRGRNNYTNSLTN
ncbi:hypothetical protein H8356DRAFT_1432111 [Neocallimastix lanati (nom. inval.)]|nr:hypothetical protein H8356DRAFT_1432111 [Neocallimastix sp. JGI-2020a]